MPIRSATEKDMPAIIDLLAQILQLHHQIRPDLFKKEGGKYDTDSLLTLMNSPETPVFVYVDEQDKVLGHMFLQFKTPEAPVRHAVKSLYIDDICVAETARGQQIGQTLYAFAKDYAKTQGCYNVTLNVWADNLDAVHFYKKLGLKPQQIQMEGIL